MDRIMNKRNYFFSAFVVACFFAAFSPSLEAFAIPSGGQAGDKNITYLEFRYFEKAYKNSPNDVEMLKTYLKFLEKNGFYLKGIELSNKLYVLTSNEAWKLKTADLYFKQGDFETGTAMYEKYYQKNPANYKVLEKLININYERGKFDKAAAYISKISKEKITPELQLKYGTSLFYSGKNEQAKSVFTSYLKKFPNDKDALSTISDVYFSLSDYSNAQKYLITLANLEPSNKETKIRLADAYFAGGNYKAADEIFSSLLKTNPNDIKLLTSVADLNMAMNNFDKAADTLELLSELTAGTKYQRETTYKLANAYFAANRLDKAEAAYLYIVERYPCDMEAKSTLADVYIASKKYNDALKLLEKLTESNPIDLNLNLKLAKLYIQRSEFNEAEYALNRVNTEHPNNLEVQELMADVRFYSQDYKTALDMYQKVYVINKSDRMTYKMAEVLRLNKQYKNAEKYYKAAMKSSEYSKEAQIGLAYLKVDRFKIMEARKIFQDVLETSPDSYEAQLGLAQTYISTEDFQKGLAILNKLPQNDEVKYEKANAYYKMEMFDSASKQIEGNKLAKARPLKADIKMENRFRIDNGFDVMKQNGDEDNKLTIKRYDVQVSKNIKGNLKPKAGFSIIPYYSGRKGYSNVAKEYSVGLEGRPVEKFEFDSKVGLMDFEHSETMLTGKLLTSYYANDVLKLNLGFERTNLERSLLSSAGLIPQAGPFSNRLVGQVADNKFTTGYVVRLPKYMFTYGTYGLGFIKGKNVPTNEYHEGVLGLGKVWFTRPKGHFIDLVMTEITGYYAGYDDNRLGFGGASLNSRYNVLGSDSINPDPNGRNPGVGGYFSPKYVFSEKAALHLRGRINKINTGYHLYSYLGMQNIANNDPDFIWGSRAMLTFNENGIMGMKVYYQIEDFNQSKRQNVGVNLFVRPW